MGILKGDIRLISGELCSAVKQIKSFLPQKGYVVISEKFSSDDVYIEACNSQDSILKLYMSNRPQILGFYIQKAEDQLKIQSICKLFVKFRIFYYAVLISLLTGSGILFASIKNNYSSPTTIEAFKDLLSDNSLLFFKALFLFLLSIAFYIRSIETQAYDGFFDQLYKRMVKNGVETLKDIQVGHTFPDLWAGFFLIGLYFIFGALYFDILSLVFYKSKIMGAILCGALAVIILCCFLLYLMNSNPALKTRVLFVLAGFSLSLPIMYYYCPPVVLSITGDLGFLIKSLYSGSNQQQVIEMAAMIYSSFTIMFFLIGGLFLAFWTQTPTRLINRIEKFHNAHPKSNYYQALIPENSSVFFNSLLLMIWGLFSIVKLLAMYISFSLLELCIFERNYLLGLDFINLFYGNTKTVLLVLFNNRLNANLIFLFHKTLMVVYAIPMVIILAVIFWKNLKLSLGDYRLFREHQFFSNEGKERSLNDRVQRICKYGGESIPGIMLIDSPRLIGAETKFIGFPIYKNHIFVSKSFWRESDEYEMDLLIAHEIGHIKRHTFLRKFLLLLSDYSLFGNGFLAVVQNSFKVEKEADTFAIKWLSFCGLDSMQAIQRLKDMLDKLEELNFKNQFFHNESINFSVFKIAKCRSEYLKRYNEFCFWKKLKTNLGIIYQIYFGNEILSYFHPPNSLRIRWLKETIAQNETR